MVVSGLGDKKDIFLLVNHLSPQNIVLFSKSLFSNEFLSFLEEKKIEVFEVVDEEKLKNLNSFKGYIDFTDFLKINLSSILEDLSKLSLYISISPDPLATDPLTQELKSDTVIKFIDLKNILNKVFGFSYEFYYQGLDYVIKYVDFFYFFFGNLGKLDSYKMNFLVFNIPYFYSNLFERLTKISDISNVFVYLPEKLIEKTLIDYLHSVMIKLRYNCQWDRIQTSESIRNHLVEEAYEVLDAIEKNDKDKFKSELGDLLLQIIFHSQIQSDFKNFNFYDVLSSLIEKLIRRHPHVFTDEKTEDLTKILVDWEKTKEKENKGNTIELPKGAPSLLKLYLLYRKIKRLKLESWFDETFRKFLSDNVDNKLASVLIAIHSFYLSSDDNLENIINNLVEKLNYIALKKN